jgi:hypothetical protein
VSQRGKGECDRCGFIYKLRLLKYEWNGYRTCPTCWDAKHPQDVPRQIGAENTALVGARPERDTLVSIGTFKGDWDVIGRSFRGAGSEPGVGEVTLT